LLRSARKAKGIIMDPMPSPNSNFDHWTAPDGQPFQMPRPRTLLAKESIERTDLLGSVGAALVPMPDRPPRNVLLFGPAGGGKTTLVHQVARMLDRRLWMMLGADTLSASNMVTRACGLCRDEQTGVTRETFKGTELLAAVAFGGILFFDEFSRTPEGALNVLLELLATRTLTCQENGFRFVAHENFAFVAAQNDGAEMLSDALADRLIPRIEVPPPSPELLTQWLRKNVPSDQNTWLSAFDEVYAAHADPGHTTRQALGALDYAFRLWSWAGKPRLTAACARQFIERAKVAS
jgi:hypothetical protein